MSIISRYLAREFVLAALAVLAGLLTIVAMADALLHIDEIAESGASALRGVGLRCLEMLPQAVPMACAVGVVWSLTRAVRFREVTAIRCGGIALRRALLPILALCLVIGAAVGVFQDRVTVPLEQRASGFEVDREETSRPRRVGRRVWYTQIPWVFAAETYDAATRTLAGVSAFKLGTDQTIERRLDADRAVSTGDGKWVFYGVLDRSFGADGMREARAAALSLALGADLPDREATAVTATLIENLSLNGLAKARERAASVSDRRLLTASFHARLALPWATLVLVLLAIPFAIGDVERGDSFPRALITSLAAAAVFWGLWTVGLFGSRADVTYPQLSIWCAVLVPLLVAAWRFRAINE